MVSGALFVLAEFAESAELLTCISLIPKLPAVTFIIHLFQPPTHRYKIRAPLFFIILFEGSVLQGIFFILFIDEALPSHSTPKDVYATAWVT